MCKFRFKLKYFIYFLFLFLLLSCSDAAKEASKIKTYSIDISVNGLADGESIQIVESKSGISRTIASNSLITLASFNLGETFLIEVIISPLDKRCTVSNNGRGLIDGSTADNISIICVKLFSVSGNITGLKSDNFALRLNLGDDLFINQKDSFIFNAVLVDGSPYTVSVLTQPTLPDQLCTVTNGIGTVSGKSVTNVAIACINDAPIASNVRITDDNSGNAMVGDNLTGNYRYNDVDEDVEGASIFRWLRNGATINGATSSTYTLGVADVPTQITFEVTPVAAIGALNGSIVMSQVLATGTAPIVRGFARYLDTNMNGISDLNDQLIVPFDQNISVNATNIRSFDLPVEGDIFGFGAFIAVGPASNEVTIILGASPNIKTQKDFSNTVTVANSASGIDVAIFMMEGVLKSASGIDAVPSMPIDIIPAYVDSGQSLGANDSTAVVLGDLDGDGDLDMVVANESDMANRVYINDGAGVFTDSGQILGANASHSIVLGDVNGDGSLDIVVANLADQPNRIYINDGMGNFVDSGQALGANFSTFVVLGDLDGDGDLDMVVANNKGQGNRVCTNDGLGSFTDIGSIGVNDSASIVLGDVDNDGDLDIVVANDSGQANRIYLNDSTGSFVDSGQMLGMNNSISVALGDVDGDGDLDIVVANSAQANRIYINDNGSFTDSGQALGENDSTFVVLGDIDGDDDLDIVVANGFGQPNQVYINNGLGNFIDSSQVLGVNTSHFVELGDVDGDGDLDIAVANIMAPNRVYLNSLAGTRGSKL